jgi:DNA repair exonuclease SbcCD nuclease subunit
MWHWSNTVSKVLYIGDPHIKQDCLEEGQRLVDYICKVAVEQHVHAIVLLGDQFHTHSVVHLSVLGFWRSAFKQMSELAYGSGSSFVYALVGNHDMSGRKGDSNNAMMLYNPEHVRVIDHHFICPWGAVFVPYCADPEQFVADCRMYPDTKLLICHQTFDGSKYENGFYAKDGIDPNLVPQEWIISGHIHTPQKFGKVWYPGSPRWQTIADANTQRSIWVIDHVDGAVIQSQQAFPTEGVCRPIYSLVDRPEAPVEIPQGDAEVIVDVYGEPDFVRQRAEELEKVGVRVRQFPATTRVAKVKESEGLPVSFRKFIVQHKPKFGTPNDRLLELAEKRISWLRAEAAA